MHTTAIETLTKAVEAMCRPSVAAAGVYDGPARFGVETYPHGFMRSVKAAVPAEKLRPGDFQPWSFWDGRPGVAERRAAACDVYGSLGYAELCGLPLSPKLSAFRDSVAVALMLPGVVSYASWTKMPRLGSATVSGAEMCARRFADDWAIYAVFDRVAGDLWACLPGFRPALEDYRAIVAAARGRNENGTNVVCDQLDLDARLGSAYLAYLRPLREALVPPYSSRPPWWLRADAFARTTELVPL